VRKTSSIHYYLLQGDTNLREEGDESRAFLGAISRTNSEEGLRGGAALIRVSSERRAPGVGACLFFELVSLEGIDIDSARLVRDFVSLL
jgi:hypothetical protein